MTPPARRRLVRIACATWASIGLAAQATPADTEPAASGASRPGTPAVDPIVGLLAERGLLGPLDASMAAVRSVHATVRDAASTLVESAMNFLGVPYRRGGSDADAGFDCSGFTRHIFERSIGLLLPRRADEQANDAGLQAVRRQELEPGDLVFFDTMRRTFSHVGIYIGEHKFIHAPRPGGEVRIDDLRASYWSRRFTGARRAELGAGLPQR